MKLRLEEKIKKQKQDLVMAVFDLDGVKNHKFFKEFSDKDKNYVLSVLNREKGDFEKIFKTVFLAERNSHVLICGFSDKSEWSAKKSDIAARKIILALKDLKSEDAAILFQDFYSPDFPKEAYFSRLLENILAADFVFDKYKKEPREGSPKIGVLSIIVPKITDELKKSFARGIVLGEAINSCRALANIPGKDMTPRVLAEAALAQEKASKGKIKVKVLNESGIKRLKMGGILGVGQGSKEKPRFIIMEYFGGKKTEKPVVFTGKGVTFDTGGINLKPDYAIEGMYMDMSGAAAVIYSMRAAAKLELKLNIVGLIPAVENMPSGESLRPGDILKTITGKTVEVLNTDAEGRIILADALGYAQKYKPRLIINVATLTGAAMVALAPRFSAVFASDKRLENLAVEAGRVSGEDVWPMPLSDDYLEDIKGTFADLANIAKTKQGGAIVGAIFLKQFTGNYPFVHLDIASTMTTFEGAYLAKGASGAGVKFLTEMARRFEKINP